MTETILIILLTWALGITFFMIILFKQNYDLNEQLAQLNRGRIMDDLLKPREKQ